MPGMALNSVHVFEMTKELLLLLKLYPYNYHFDTFCYVLLQMLKYVVVSLF